ncbi:MAG TPA: sigma-70 family RNA polymerase sigma factor [Urbifossiella sp.]|jgi:RNA polymerase sigma factor (sigma-70 family)|nr:sigma-70 family RNA polymerase sigma factor [Urbifossiella sp.]
MLSADPVALAARLARLAAPTPDADLLTRFATTRDGEAFAELVHRHGPAVLAACRGVTRHAHDAEDAFQATFLVLARKAGRVRPGPLAGWLYGVAVRAARKAAGRPHRRKEVTGADVPDVPERAAGGFDPDAARAVAEEVGQLSPWYRAPVVLCELEGRSRAAAAQELGIAEGTLSSRLAKARKELARRLAARGFGPAALAAAVGAVVPPELTARTVALASGGPGPAAVLTLANEVTRAMPFTQIKAAAVALLAAGLAAAAVAARPQPAPQPAAPQPAPAKADPPAPKREPTAARKLIDRLRELKPQNGSEALTDVSAAALRDLVNLGPAAVPDVIAELDATTDPFLLRCLGFAARAIGDRRVVPALIRALPKTCVPAGSDFGLKSADPELLAFMQAHSQQKQVVAIRGTYYSFGRPINEFRTALQKLTGANHGEDELAGVFLGGSARQQYLQRDLYRRCAERWAAWWEKNAKPFVADPEYATVGLPPRPPVVAAPAAAPFPHGPRAEIGRGMGGGLLEPAGAKGAMCVVRDLDTGRWAALPEKFRPEPGQPEPLDDILAWAAEEGYDIMGTKYSTPGGSGPHYVIRGLGLTAWQIDAGRRKTLATEIKADGPLEMGTQVGGALLAPFDVATGKHKADETGLFLYRTREGGFGWIFVGVEVHNDGLRVGTPARGDLELNPVGITKGRRFGYTPVWDGAQEAGGRK